MAMSSVVQVLSLQAEELQAKRREMADLRRRLADKELELSTAKAELHLFERRYQNVVGPMYGDWTGLRRRFWVWLASFTLKPKTSAKKRNRPVSRPMNSRKKSRA